MKVVVSQNFKGGDSLAAFIYKIPTKAG